MNSSPAIIFNKHLAPAREAVEQVLFEVCEQKAKAAALPQVARRMVVLFHEQHTLDDVCQRVGLSREKGHTVTQKLIALGILRLSGARADFTSLEEDFFAAEVPPIDECNEPFSSMIHKVKRFFSLNRGAP